MDIERLNISVRGEPSVGFGGSASVFQEVAAYTGKSLPEDYILFIRTVDGGHPEIGSFVPEGSSTDNVFDVNSFYSFDNRNGKNIRDAIDRWRHVLGSTAFPIVSLSSLGRSPKCSFHCPYPELESGG